MGLERSYSGLIHIEHPHLSVPRAKFSLFRHYPKHDGSQVPHGGKREGMTPCESLQWLRLCHRLRCGHPEPFSLVTRDKQPTFLGPLYSQDSHHPAGCPTQAETVPISNVNRHLVITFDSLEMEVIPYKVCLPCSF